MKPFRCAHSIGAPSPLNLTVLVSLGLTSAQAAPAGPTEALATIPPLVYRSPFETYRPFDAEATVSWKDANETVGKIGGWRAYAKEAAEAARRREAEQAGKQPPRPAPSQPVPSAQPTQKSDEPPRPVHRHGG